MKNSYFFKNYIYLQKIFELRYRTNLIEQTLSKQYTYAEHLVVAYAVACKFVSQSLELSGYGEPGPNN